MEAAEDTDHGAGTERDLSTVSESRSLLRNLYLPISACRYLSESCVRLCPGWAAVAKITASAYCENTE